MPCNAKINIIGNLTKEPETRDVNGNNVVTLSVAVNTNIRLQDGTYKTDFYTVSVWGKQGEALMQRLQKGSGVWASGDFSSNEYVGRDGKQHLSLRIDSADVRGIARLKTGDQQAQTQRQSSPRASAQQQSADNTLPF